MMDVLHATDARVTLVIFSSDLSEQLGKVSTPNLLELR